MAVVQIPASHSGVADAPEAPVARPRVVMVGTAFAVAGCLAFFVALLGIYLHERALMVDTGATWLPEKVVVPLQQPNVMFLALIASSFTIQWAVDAIRRDDRSQTFLAMGITLVLGFASLNMAAYIYSIMNLDISLVTPMPILTYTITGAHVLMLVVAMIFAGLMTFRALGGQYTSRQHDGISAAALFWHAQVIVYAFIWFAIFITK